MLLLFSVLVLFLTCLDVTSQPILRTKGGKFVLGRPTMIDVKLSGAHGNNLAGSISRKASQKMEKKKRIYNIEVGEPKAATLSLSSPVEFPDGEHGGGMLCECCWVRFLLSVFLSFFRSLFFLSWFLSSSCLLLFHFPCACVL
jgi:hypothetical protein